MAPWLRASDGGCCHWCACTDVLYFGTACLQRRAQRRRNSPRETLGLRNPLRQPSRLRSRSDVADFGSSLPVIDEVVRHNTGVIREGAIVRITVHVLVEPLSNEERELLRKQSNFNQAFKVDK